ncbi:Tetratricopeptide repeat-containing protein [Terribacillus halophilus]|uniref:Tetratricopeptide repeat-containing protein n=1 Tax=Terribacillus halophilus TaxID=361279 RepID=A0A1G6KPQ1_9BACI|nr:tetratricopeptide repeat protein [Terribacillus halophilus]SDC33092.1 Tetratricopeptide repeat-containing protein [Terribacillus halophilus]
MSIWDVLELEPTDDKKIIKKAYASKLRICRPDDDPEGYQELREAYEKALRYDPNDIDHEPQEPDDMQAPQLDEVNRTMNAFYHLYNDFSDPNRLDRLRQWLQQDIVWNIEKSEELQRRLIDFLSQHPYLPKEAYKMLDQAFHWQERESELHAYHDDNVIQGLMDRLLGVRQFKAIEAGEAFDYAKYYSLREFAKDLLSEGDYDQAAVMLNKGYEMYTSDPELLRLISVYETAAGEKDRAVWALSKALEQKEDTAMYLDRAQLLVDDGQYEAALHDYKRVYQIDPAIKTAAGGAAYCQQQLGQIKEAVETLKPETGVVKEEIGFFKTSFQGCLFNPLFGGERTRSSFKENFFQVVFALLGGIGFLIKTWWIYILGFCLLEWLFDPPALLTAVLAIPLIVAFLGIMWGNRMRPGIVNLDFSFAIGLLIIVPYLLFKLLAMPFKLLGKKKSKEEAAG